MTRFEELLAKNQLTSIRFTTNQREPLLYLATGYTGDIDTHPGSPHASLDEAVKALFKIKTAPSTRVAEAWLAQNPTKYVELLREEQFLPNGDPRVFLGNASGAHIYLLSSAKAYQQAMFILRSSLKHE